MFFAPVDERRHLRFACFDHVRAARMKSAADGRIHRRRWITRQDNAAGFAYKSKHFSAQDRDSVEPSRNPSD